MMPVFLLIISALLLAVASAASFRGAFYPNDKRLGIAESHASSFIQRKLPAPTCANEGEKSSHCDPPPSPGGGPIRNYPCCEPYTYCDSEGRCRAPSTPPPTTTSAPPTTSPTPEPTAPPTTGPTNSPSSTPTHNPTAPPSPEPTAPPTVQPTAPPTSPSAQQMSCPEEHCANDVVNNAAIVDSTTICPDVSIMTLDTYEYNGIVLIELKGPARNGTYSAADAADLVITAPHGGDCDDDEGCTFIPDRATTGTYCPKGCKTARDSYTKEISNYLQAKILSNYCRVPFLVINHLHRIKLDANREIGEAAQGDPIAEEAWLQFHDLTSYAQELLEAQFGTSVVTSNIGNDYTGIKSLLIDMHGYSGYDWAEDGCPFIQWGYRLSDDWSLNPENFCPLDERSNYTAGTFTHARWIEGQSYECIVRGPRSLASRVATHIDDRGGLLGQSNECGHGIPSYEHASPWSLANDASYCDDVNDGGTCHYYAGGFDVDVHERLNWQDETGHHMNTVQAELPRCIRWSNDTIREEFADIMSIAVYSFLRDLYG